MSCCIRDLSSLFPVSFSTGGIFHRISVCLRGASFDRRSTREQREENELHRADSLPVNVRMPPGLLVLSPGEDTGKQPKPGVDPRLLLLRCRQLVHHHPRQTAFLSLLVLLPWVHSIYLTLSPARSVSMTVKREELRPHARCRASKRTYPHDVTGSTIYMS